MRDWFLLAVWPVMFGGIYLWGRAATRWYEAKKGRKYYAYEYLPWWIKLLHALAGGKSPSPKWGVATITLTQEELYFALLAVKERYEEWFKEHPLASANTMAAVTQRDLIRKLEAKNAWAEKEFS